MLTRTTSSALIRRNSSLTLRIRGKQPSLQKCALQNATPHLPVELIEIIVDFMLSSRSLDHTFAAIAAFTQASISFRELALRRYFRDVVIESRSQFSRLLDILSAQTRVIGEYCGFRWVRSLSTSAHAITRHIHRIELFAKLRTLEIAFASEGFETQDLLIKLLLCAFIDLHARHGLKKLIISSIPRIETRLLISIAETFPQLVILELTSMERLDSSCCASCFADSLLYTRHSPIPDHYSTVEKFATSFANALAPLDKLEDLFLGILLSDASILEEHALHSLGDEGGEVLPGLCLCPACGTHRVETQGREAIAASILANSLPCLTSIRWNSLFARMDKDQQNTTVVEKGSYNNGLGPRVDGILVLSPPMCTRFTVKRGIEPEQIVLKRAYE